MFIKLLNIQVEKCLYFNQIKPYQEKLLLISILNQKIPIIKHKQDQKVSYKLKIKSFFMTI